MRKGGKKGYGTLSRGKHEKKQWQRKKYKILGIFQEHSQKSPRTKKKKKLSL